MIDFSSFAKAAGMLYTSAFLAERYAGIRPFLESKVRHPHNLMRCTYMCPPSSTVSLRLLLLQLLPVPWTAGEACRRGLTGLR